MNHRLFNCVTSRSVLSWKQRFIIFSTIFFSVPLTREQNKSGHQKYFYKLQDELISLFLFITVIPILFIFIIKIFVSLFLYNLIKITSNWSTSFFFKLNILTYFRGIENEGEILPCSLSARAQPNEIGMNTVSFK